jgi:hypothetical protein
MEIRPYLVTDSHREANKQEGSQHHFVAKMVYGRCVPYLGLVAIPLWHSGTALSLRKHEQ